MMKTAAQTANAGPADRLSASVPRYTSYPTAPHFHKDIGETDYRAWLEQLPSGDGVSVYIHIPFCDRLCWFCGCHTKQINRYDPIPPYLKTIHREVELLRQAIGFTPALRQLHLGGGSPSMLRPRDLGALRAVLTRHFRIDDDAAISVEIDPSDLDAHAYTAFEDFGITRASIGVQDFDTRVQRAINRPQTFNQTATAVDALRAAGATSVNIDALYGLPFQTEKTIEKTMAKVVSLAPDRIALFGYAHVPWIKTHQKMIPDAALPGPGERLAQSEVAAEILIADGYVQIGIDHFARPDDRLAIAAANRSLRRNFQGYTDDPCTTLLGIGASSIGGLPQGYIQNEPATGTYMRMISEGSLPISRGIQLTLDDRLCADVIEQLMCNFDFSLRQLRLRHGEAVAGIDRRIDEVVKTGHEDLVAFDGDRFSILPNAHAFTRIVASWFDARLHTKETRYSLAV